MPLCMYMRSGVRFFDLQMGPCPRLAAADLYHQLNRTAQGQLCVPTMRCTPSSTQSHSASTPHTPQRCKSFDCQSALVPQQSFVNLSNCRSQARRAECFKNRSHLHVAALPPRFATCAGNHMSRVHVRCWLSALLSCPGPFAPGMGLWAPSRAHPAHPFPPACGSANSAKDLQHQHAHHACLLAVQLAWPSCVVLPMLPRRAALCI